MKSKKIFLIALVGLFLLSSCAKIYYSPDCYAASSRHKIIAILPPTVSIAARRNIDAQAIIEQQKTESLNLQKEMMAWMLKRKMKGKFETEIQDIETTNIKLKKAGYPETLLTPADICNVIGVDGVITSNYSLSKPMSDGAAVALGVLAGVWGTTNEVKVSMSIHDAKTQKMIWNFDQHYTGSIGSSTSSLIDALMRRASKKMPYKN
jgi:hypothetical protein